MKMQMKRHSYRDYSGGVSNRSLLANALESDMMNKAERKYLAEYKAVLEKYEAKQSELELLKDSFFIYKHNYFELMEFEKKINSVTELIDEYDEHLRDLEKKLKKVIDREKTKAYQAYGIEAPSPKEKTSIKERLLNSFGMVGIVLYFASRLIIAVLPFVMIGGNFLFTLLLIGINTLVPFASVVFWIWGLVCAIKGVQDFWAILYYICFVVIWLPYFIETIASIFSNKK